MEGSGSEHGENEKWKEEHNLEFGKLKCVVGVGDDDDDVMEAMVDVWVCCVVSVQKLWLLRNEWIWGGEVHAMARNGWFEQSKG